MTALVHKDRVLEVSNTTGTGAFLLGGNQSGYYTFFASFGAGVQVGYVAANPVSGENEVGKGTVINNGDGTYSLSRDVVERSSNGNALVDFAGGRKLIANVLLASEADAVADLVNVILKDGSVAFAANQSMGGNKLTNLADATAATDAVNLETADALITAAETSLTSTIEAWVTAQGYGTGSGNVSATGPTVPYNVPYWLDNARHLANASPVVVHAADDGSVSKVETQSATFEEYLTATYGATVTLNFDTANNWDIPLTGNPTMAYASSSANKGQRVFLRFLQDATGGRVVAAWFSGINWNNDLPPVFDPRPNGIDVIGLECVTVDSYGNATWEEIYRKTSAPRKGITTLTYASTISYDARISPKQIVTLTGNPTLAIAASSQAGQYTLYAGQLFQVGLAQDGTGSRVATWFSGITSTPPAQSTTPGLLDWYLFCCRDPVTPKFDLVGYQLGLAL